MAILGTLTKITAAKKLMIRVKAEVYHNMTNRVHEIATKHNFTDYAKPIWTSNYDGENSYFLMVKLDKYDIQNMIKFERMLKNTVAITGIMKEYCFIPEGETEQKCGINFTLTTIRMIRPKPPSFDMLAEVAAIRAEERLLSRESRLNALEQAIDGDVEAMVAANLMPPAPRLVRQNAVSRLASSMFLPAPKNPGMTNLNSNLRDAISRSSEPSLEEVNAAIAAHEAVHSRQSPRTRGLTRASSSSSASSNDS